MVVFFVALIYWMKLSTILKKQEETTFPPHVLHGVGDLINKGPCQIHFYEYLSRYLKDA